MGWVGKEGEGWGEPRACGCPAPSQWTPRTAPPIPLRRDRIHLGQEGAHRCLSGYSGCPPGFCLFLSPGALSIGWRTKGSWESSWASWAPSREVVWGLGVGQGCLGMAYKQTDRQTRGGPSLKASVQEPAL